MKLEHQDTLSMLGSLVITGIVVALGKLLLGGEPITWRLVLGRMIIGAGLSVAAAAALLWQPALPPLGLVGIGAALGILGQHLIERVVQIWLNKIPPAP